MSEQEFSKLVGIDGSKCSLALIHEPHDSGNTVGFFDKDGTSLGFLKERERPYLTRRIIDLVKGSWSPRKQVADYTEYRR